LFPDILYRYNLYFITHPAGEGLALSAAWSISSGVTVLDTGLPCSVPAEMGGTAPQENPLSQNVGVAKGKIKGLQFATDRFEECSAACRRLVPPSFATPLAPSFVKETQ
jgi:hypothetical protein